MRWVSTKFTLLVLVASISLVTNACSSSTDSTAPVEPGATDTTVSDAASGSDMMGSDVEADVPPLNLCTDDAECTEPGATCTCNGVCEVFDTNPCLVDKNCPSDQFCDVCAGFCAPEVGLCEACKSDAACGDGGACLPFVSGGSFCANECISDLGCQVGYSCLAVDGYTQKLCVPDSGECADLGLCESDGECPDGQVCSDNLKVCAPGCSEARRRGLVSRRARR